MNSAQPNHKEFHNGTDQKSIGNYTGLENLNLRDNQEDMCVDVKEEDVKKKCTCTCECELCVSLKTYQEAKNMGLIDFNFSNNLTYLNHLNSSNYVHDLKYNLEHNLENFDNFEDMIRLLPDSKLLIAIITFNMNGKHCTNLNELLLPDQLETFPDIYVVGTQEFIGRDNQDVKEWTIDLQTHIGPTHVLLHDAAFGVLHISLFIRRDLIWFVSIPEDDSLLCKLNPPTNYIRTKGAVAISLKIFGTSFLFVDTHLPAHQSKIQERIEEYGRLSTGLDLPRNIKSSLKRSYLSHDISNRFDNVFWFGDLNFRVDQDQETVLEEIENAKVLKDFDSILLHDQLSLSMAKGDVLLGFEEPDINFPPTYKYLINSNEYDSESTRIPSYTDRILFKNKRKNHINCNLYTSIQNVKTSDHKPVFALFSVSIKPGTDDSQPNAGLFQHDVYVEGLRRQAFRRTQTRNDLPERPISKGLLAHLKARFQNSVG